MENFGLIQKKIDPRDWVVGSNTPIETPVLVKDGNWSKFLPVNEKQRFDSLETMACVSYSALNVFEMLFKALFAIDVNYSDRALAKMSMTTKRGNSLRAVADTILNQGLVFEEDWPIPTTYDWEHYYSKIPDDVRLKAKNITKKFSFNHEWVYLDNFKENLKYAPLQVTVQAWNSNNDGIYYNNSDSQNHAVVLVGYDGDNPLIYDSYDPYVKKLTPDYKFGLYAKKFSINKIKSMEYEVLDNYLYQLVDGHGGFAVGLDGRLIIDDVDKLLATFISRNDGDIINKTIKVRQDFWDKFDKVNLKGDIIN